MLNAMKESQKMAQQKSVHRKMDKLSTSVVAHNQKLFDKVEESESEAAQGHSNASFEDEMQDEEYSDHSTDDEAEETNEVDEEQEADDSVNEAFERQRREFEEREEALKSKFAAIEQQNADRLAQYYEHQLLEMRRQSELYKRTPEIAAAQNNQLQKELGYAPTPIEQKPRGRPVKNTHFPINMKAVRDALPSPNSSPARQSDDEILNVDTNTPPQTPPSGTVLAIVNQAQLSDIVSHAMNPAAPQQ